MNLTLKTELLDFGFSTIHRPKRLTPIIMSTKKVMVNRLSPKMNQFDPALNSFILESDLKNKGKYYRVQKKNPNTCVNSPTSGDRLKPLKAVHPVNFS
jgi:hypothetical protein